MDIKSLLTPMRTSIFEKKYLIPIFLLVAVIFSLNTHWMVLREFHMPTYGNTMIHIASARHIVEHQEYPLIDYSYGGGIPNLYVPLYRVLVADGVLLTGLSYDLVSRLLVLLFAILLPLGFYLLGKKLFGETVGVLCALLCVLPGELLIYTVRPLPQALGLVLLPIAFHAFYSRNLPAAIILTFLITMIHQEAIAYLLGGIGMYFGFVILHMLWRVLLSKNYQFEKHSELMKFSIYCIFLAVISYFAWQYAIVGHFNVFDLAQFKNHEGNTVSMDSYILKTGNIIATFSLAGLFICIAYLFRHFLNDIYLKSDELKDAVFVFFIYLFAAFGSYFVLNNFSLDRKMSLISISLPVYLGPLSGNEIIPISLLTGLFGVFLLKALNLRVFEKADKLAFLFIFALFSAGLFAVKNDMIGLKVFMDRFLVYLQIPLILLSALGVYSILILLKDRLSPSSA
jgi:hypothetical protein